MGRPRGHAPKNKGRRNSTRSPIGATVPAVRHLFELVDGHPDRISLRAFGQLTGYSDVSLSIWRSGKTVPLLRNLSDLAEGLGYRVVLEKIEPEEESLK